MIAYFDCFSGISGDMSLAALIDAGADARLLDQTIAALGLRGEIRAVISRENSGARRRNARYYRVASR